MNSILLNPSDNIAVIADQGGIAGGARIRHAGTAGGENVVARAAIPFGHKVALVDIPAGAPILKFGHVIGTASRSILAGEHVHVQNVALPPDSGPVLDAEIHRSAEASRAWANLPSTFSGYRRPDGTAGVRNYVVVSSSVNCSATVVKAVCRHFEKQDLGRHGLDGVLPVTHGSGCAQAVGGLSYRVLNRTLAGWIFHPNVVGAVVIGLGCEGTTFKSILETRNALPGKIDIPVETTNIQDEGGTAAAIQEGIALVEKVIARLPKFARTPIPVSELGLALNCGGSDAFSSITANPALGLASDILVSKGGMVCLAEIPECHGAEGLLLRRAATPEVRASLQKVFDWWRDYAARQRVSLNENLAPGNIAGGITTIIEKSLGAVAKAGHAPLSQVVDYAEPITRKGFTLMNTPGFDPVSVTGLVAGGCNMVAFTTGRGSVYGCGIAPTIKIATTSDLFRRMSGDMDVDAGKALAGVPLEEVAATLYEFMVEVASGRKTNSEKLGLGWEEFVPWSIAETL